MTKTLRELAEAATPGPWEYESFGQRVFAESVGGCRLERSKFTLADIRGWGHLQYLPDGAAKQDANGEYIAAASPGVVLHLLDVEQQQSDDLTRFTEENRALRQRVAELERDAAQARINLGRIKQCLQEANSADNGPIHDTIWYSDYETLFDFIDAAMKEVQ